MGIKKLFTFLNNNNLYKTYPYLSDLITELKLDKKRVLIGIDGNLFCYKYSHSFDNMIIGFFNQILKFLSNGLIPFYIFDGGTIREKDSTNNVRHNKKQINKFKLNQLNEQVLNDEINTEDTEFILLKKKFERNSIKISLDKILTLLELFDILNIPYIFSHGEGEYLAVLLNKYNIIDMLLTDDTDPIPAGINKLIKFYNNNVYYLDKKNIDDKLNMSSSQLCDFCILLGSDYATFRHGLKPAEIYDQIIKYNSIENIIINKSIENINLESLDVVNKIRNIYYNSATNEKLLFLDPNSNSEFAYNIIIDHNNLNYYSNSMLEYWDDFISVLNCEDDKQQIQLTSDVFKTNIYNYIQNKKFNIKNITRFLKNNILDLTELEIKNAVISFDYLNTFGI